MVTVDADLRIDRKRRLDLDDLGRIVLPGEAANGGVMDLEEGARLRGASRG